MFQLMPLPPKHLLLSEVESLYLEAFPPEERRPVSLMRHLHQVKPYFQIEAILENGQGGHKSFLGFVTTWNLGSIYFIDHFAVRANSRGRGVGAWVLHKLQVRSKAPLILEVELPETLMAERRISFYRRLGFRLWSDVPYLQPSYADGVPFVPMHLMSYGEIDIARQISEISMLLYTEVYGLNGKPPKGLDFKT